jgi:acyl transferase domain-containing protein/acyl carrier protein
LQILPISARTPSALDALSVRLADTFAAMSANDFEDVAWTLATGRARFPHRRVVVAKTAADAASRLRSREAGHVATRLASMDDAMPPIVFLFSGHGGQYPGMGRGLYATEPVFREALDAISAALAATAGRDLREIILSEEVHRIEWTQPAVFALQIALARLWESRGVRPSAMMGHSAGEYAAACCAGVFSPEDGVRLMAERGRLIRSTRPGAMLAVPLPEKDLIARIGTSTALSLAVVTTPAMGVLSGEPEAIAAFHEAAEADGIECRTVEIDRAAHSSLMDPIVAPFRIVAAGLMLRSPRIPFISNITGAPIAPEEATSPDYWARHLRAPVRFSDGIAALAEKHPRALFIEIGPGRTLAAPVSRHPATAGCLVLSSIRHPEDRIEDAEFFARTLGALWTAGLDLDWEKIHRGSRRRALLPTMPFERKRHWIEPPVRGASLAPAPAPVAERPDLASWIHEPVLVEAPLPATDPSPGRIVIIESEAGTGERLEAAIGSSAIEVMRVAVMEGETPAALLDRLGDALAERIVFLSNGDESETNRSFVFLASLAREILARHDGRPLRFFAVVSDCSESPDRAALRGVLRVLPIEEPAIETRFIEVDFVEDEPAADATARAVAAEILAADRDRPHVVYRDGRRFLPEARRIGRPVLEPMLEDHSRVLSKRQPEDRRSEDHLFSFWRNNGVYLITGGLGSMGLAFAEWIARQARARIVLLDRCGISDGEAGRRARDRIAAIERTGSTVTVEIADVASAAALAGVVARACGQGPLVGVIHTAGIIGGALLVDWTESGAEAVFAPKLGGALALEEALAGRPPEFLVACSSLASRIPVAGQADYAGANAALDAWARRFARRTGAYAVSIAWGFWQELGMIEKAAMPPAEKKRLAEEIARRGWSNAGVEVLDAILRGRLGPEVIVSPEPLAPRLKERPAPAPRPVAHPLLGERLLEGGSVHFRARLSAATHGILDDHRLDGRPVLVGTAYLEMARAAFVEEKGAGPVEIRDVVFLQPLLLASDETREVRTVLVERDGACEFFVVSSKDDSVGAQHAAEEATSCRPAAPLPSWRGAVPQHDRLSPSDSSAAVWRLHARGEARRFDARPDVPSPWRIDDLQPALSSFHTRMAGFGPRWENISQARFSGDATRAAALLALPSSFMDEAADFAIHPALLDNATGFLPIQAAPENVTRLPFSYARVIFHAPASGPIRVEALASGAATNDETAYAARLFDPDGHLLFESEGYLLRRVETDRAESAIENAALELPVRGALDSIRLAPAPRPAPGEGEIEIEVKCSGLNFIETLHALGLLPDPAGMVWRFGLECAGVVARVGAEVRDFKPGDRVMAFANGASQSYMIAPTHCVALIPDRLSFEEAATLPAAYMTAHTALVRKGGLARGESVLIHSAAGGVGLAAVHVARAVGAEVFATAGTEEKRAWLRAQGIATVMDSRSGAFVEESLAATGGRGLDVVLNSLGGEMIDRGLSVLAVNGRFLELGKRDIFAGTPVSLRHFEKMISFIAIDVGPDMAGFDAAWSEVTDRIASGDYPPLPRRTFPASDAAAAFAEMAGGRHIGRLLLDFSDRAAVLASAIVPAVRLQTLEEITGIAPSSDDAEASVTLIEGTEGVVARVWSEVLGRTGIMPDDDFFALQGDSLLGAQVVARLRRRFGVKLPAGALFAERTVRRLAARIDGLLAPAADEEEGTI